MLAGRMDALSLVMLAGSVGLGSPWLAGVAPLWPAALSAGAGTAALTWRVARKLSAPHYSRSSKDDFVLESDKPLKIKDEERPGSMRIGLTTDNHLPINLTADRLVRHTAIIGQSGVGKTTLGEYLLWQQTARGGGWLFIDAKIDRDVRDHLAYMCQTLGREDELYILDVSNPDNSNTYNPILHGDADEVASRSMNLIPSSEQNPGADYYRQSANHALTVIVAALQAAGQRYHFGDLALLLQSDSALAQLERMTPPGGEKRALSIFLDQFRSRSKEGVRIDINRLKQVLGGMAGRIALFAQGKFGQVFNCYAPEIVLPELIKNNKMVYVSLPTMGKDTAALNVAKMVVSDLRSAVAYMQDLPKAERPNPAYIALLDEMGAYVMEGVSRLFEQARNANIALVPAFQSFSQLNRVSPDFADIVVQNTWNKILFKFGTKDSTEDAVEILGKTMRQQRTVTLSANQGDSSQVLRTTPQANHSDAGGMGESYREVEDYRVTPDQLRSLVAGQAVMITGSQLYHVRTPMINWPKHIPAYQVVRHPTRVPRKVGCLRFEERLKEFLTEDDDSQGKDASKGGQGQQAPKTDTAEKDKKGKEAATS